MNRNNFGALLLWGGAELMGGLVWPYKGNGNTAPKYGKSRNARIPPSYKQGLAISVTVFVIEVICTFIGVVFFDRLSHKAQQIVFDLGMIAAGIGLIAFTVVLGIHEHLERRWNRITKGKKHFTQSELRKYEDLLYCRKRKEKNRREKKL